MGVFFKEVFAILTREDRRRFGSAMVAIVAMAVAEVLGIASIMPFMAVLGSPESIEQNVYLASVYRMGGFGSPKEFLIALGALVFLLLIVTSAVKAAGTWVMLRFAHVQNYYLSKRLLASYLSQPYEFFLNQNTSDLAKNILDETNKIVVGVFEPGMKALAKTIMALFIIGLLFYQDPLLALITGVVLGGAYLLIYKFFRGRLNRMGKLRVTSNRDRYKFALEALGGIKDVKILDKESYYLGRYDRPAYVFATTQTNHRVIGQIPKFAMEAVAFGGILLIILYLLGTRSEISQALPVLSLYAFAGYRLLPALQEIFAGLTQMRTHMHVFDIVARDMRLHLDRSSRPTGGPEKDPGFEPIRRIAFDTVCYRYPDTARNAVDQVSFEIKANTTVGFVGASGSGKTTTIDVLLGLLNPGSGFLRVNDRIIGEDNRKAWQRQIGYVQQHIFLADDTVAGNIAFGVPPEQIDMEAVHRAAGMASIHDFILNDMPQGYDTLVGERGIRLSGGQRQRIGIARALYRDPQVLVFDEATSALDNQTESCVMEAVQRLAHSKTIILIAHRISTVARADQIFVMAQGRVTDAGDYGTLMRESAEFRKVAEAAVS